ncbi:uncharacterized protein G2W53_008401 [Senna tora]|uniref:Uncharacterized protein n=1 Tax=Senna tora TaxID=362788 RepID=A0A834X834_9FABA|nr:uncharacterized protein G2W53_008401 [Senna tora]
MAVAPSGALHSFDNCYVITAFSLSQAWVSSPVCQALVAGVRTRFFLLASPLVAATMADETQNDMKEEVPEVSALFSTP